MPIETTVNRGKRIAVTSSSDARYVPGLLTTIWSICNSVKPETDLIFYILDNGIGFFNRRGLKRMLSTFKHIRCDIKFLKADTKFFNNLPAYHGGRTPYIRLYLQDIIMEEKFVIYTDSDILWGRDINELWALRNENVSLQAVVNRPGFPIDQKVFSQIEAFSKEGFHVDPEKYFCSGLMIINLEKLRDIGFTKKVNEIIVNHKSVINYADQDVYNILLPFPQTALLPDYWDYFECTPKEKLDDSCVIHYAANAPWVYKPLLGMERWWNAFLRASIKARMPLMILRAFSGGMLQRLLMTKIGFELFYFPFRLLCPVRYRHRKNRMFSK